MHDKMYYTYIVASRSRNLYLGMTSQIEIRMQQHKSGTFEGHSSDYNCNRLVYFERHPYRQRRHSPGETTQRLAARKENLAHRTDQFNLGRSKRSMGNIPLQHSRRKRRSFDSVRCKKRTGLRSG